jgi:hypothetical protein
MSITTQPPPPSDPRTAAEWIETRSGGPSLCLRAAEQSAWISHAGCCKNGQIPFAHRGVDETPALERTVGAASVTHGYSSFPPFRMMPAMGASL